MFPFGNYEQKIDDMNINCYLVVIHVPHWMYMRRLHALLRRLNIFTRFIA